MEGERESVKIEILFCDEVKVVQVGGATVLPRSRMSLHGENKSPNT